MNYVKLSKEISYALRHNPKAYNLALDEEGFVSVEQLINALNEKSKYKEAITIDDLIHVMEISDKQRLEINEDKIRALYGHTIETPIRKTAAIPPSILYHGTSHEALEKILKEGLKGMKRQYVHLSIDEETAINVGKRRDNEPIILKIDTAKARTLGTSFYMGNDKVWLSSQIAPEAIIVD